MRKTKAPNLLKDNGPLCRKLDEAGYLDDALHEVGALELRIRQTQQSISPTSSPSRPFEFVAADFDELGRTVKVLKHERRNLLRAFNVTSVKSIVAKFASLQSENKMLAAELADKKAALQERDNDREESRRLKVENIQVRENAKRVAAENQLLREENEALKNTAKAMNDENSTLLRDLAEYRKRWREEKARNDEVEAAIPAREDVIREKQGKLEQCETVIAKLDAANKELEAENALLKLKLLEREKEVQEISEREKQVLDEVRREKRQIASQFAKHKELVVKTLCCEKEREIAELRKEKDQKILRLRRARKREIQQRQEEIAKLKQDHENEIGGVVRDRDEKVRKAVEERSAQVARVSQEKAEEILKLTQEYDAKVAKLTERIAVVTKEKDEAVQRLTQQKEDAIAKLSKEKVKAISKKKQKSEEAITDLRRKQELEISGLKREKEEAVARLLREHEVTISNLNQEKEREITKLRKEKERAISSITQEKLQEITRLQQQLATATQVSKETQAQMKSDMKIEMESAKRVYEEQIGRLQQQIKEREEKGQEKVVELKHQNEQAVESLTQQKQECSRLNDDLAAVTKLLSEKENIIARLNEEKLDLSQNLAQLQLEYQAMSKQVEMNAFELEALKRPQTPQIIRNTSDDPEFLSQQIVMLKTKLRDISDQLVSANEEIALLHSEKGTHDGDERIPNESVKDNISASQQHMADLTIEQNRRKSLANLLARTVRMFNQKSDELIASSDSAIQDLCTQIEFVQAKIQELQISGGQTFVLEQFQALINATWDQFGTGDAPVLSHFVRFPSKFKTMIEEVIAMQQWGMKHVINSVEQELKEQLSTTSV